MDVPLSWLRSFVAVTEERHFARAAERLDLSSSSVSRHVAGLERAIGVALFRRTSRVVVPTDEGRAMYTEVADALATLEGALARVADAPRKVRIGYVSWAEREILPALARGQTTETAIPLELVRMRSSDQLDALLRGDLDIGIQWAIGVPRLGEELSIAPLQAHTLAVALPAGHRYAGFPELELAMLAREIWLMGPGASDHVLREGLVAACRAAGFTPQIAGVADGLPAQFALVGGGQGIGVVPVAYDPPDDRVVLSPLRDLVANLVAVAVTAPGRRVATLVDHLVAVARDRA